MCAARLRQAPWFVLACVTLAACVRRDHGFRFEERVGVVQNARDSTRCLTIANAGLRVGDPLVVVSPARPQSVGSAQVTARRRGPCTEPGDEWGNVSIPGAAFYTVSRAADTSLAELGIAIVQSQPIRVTNDVASGDLDGDGVDERFSQCASQEGVHLRIVTPTPKGELERWHQYFYVPYDLEPNCP